MFTLKTLIILLIILVLIILGVNVYLIIIQRFPFAKTIVPPIKTKFSNKIKAWVINLDKNKKRLSQFNRYYHASDIRSIPLERFSAVNGQEVDIQQYVTEKAYKQIQFSENNGYRTKHYELTRGAVGCFLSHVTLYYRLLRDSTHDYYLIFEDDAVFSPEIMENFSIYMESLPYNWDIFNLGTIHQELFRTERYFTKLRVFWGLFGYVINKRGAQKIIDQYEHEKISKQIDSMMSVLTINNRFFVYGLIKPLVKQDAGFGTDVQLKLRKNVSVDPFSLEEYVNVAVNMLPQKMKEQFTQEFIEEFQE